MADRRKLQVEIDKCLKKVTEGVESFEDTWQKVHTATNANQREKFEADLKKEIKKLQRLRDQIKTWLQSSEVKDKSGLQDARKLIETQMERFKAVEKETKVKAYSKEGLGAPVKLDPLQKEKDDCEMWISTTIERLGIQIDKFETKIETTNQILKKKKNDKEKSEELAQLNNNVQKHNYYVAQLEALLRKLDNGEIEVDTIKGIEEYVLFYIECSQDEDFQEDAFIFVDQGLESFDEYITSQQEACNQQVQDRKSSINDEDSSTAFSNTPFSTSSSSPSHSLCAENSMIEVHSTCLPNSTNISQSTVSTCNISSTSSEMNGPTVSHVNTHANNAVIKSETSSTDSVVSATSDSTQSSSISQSEENHHSHADDVSRPMPIEKPLQKTVSRFTSSWQTTDHRFMNGFGPNPESKVVGDSSKLVNGENRLPTMKSNGDEVFYNSVIQDSADFSGLDLLSELATERLNSDLPHPSLLNGDITSHSSFQNMDSNESKIWITSSDWESYDRTDRERTQLQQKLENSSIEMDPSLNSTTCNKDQSSTHNFNHEVPPFSEPEPVLPSTVPATVDFERLNINEIFGVYDRQYSADETAQISMLTNSYNHMTDAYDSQRYRYLMPFSIVRPPPYYPTRLPKSEKIEFFLKFSTETLFFIFYFLQGTKAQYLAAKALKSKSWRFHTMFMMWFQRHEEPKTITDEYEQGTYIYFDYEKWSQRKKEGFTFEYKYLEDNELN